MRLMVSMRFMDFHGRFDRKVSILSMGSWKRGVMLWAYARAYIEACYVFHGA